MDVKDVVAALAITRQEFNKLSLCVSGVMQAVTSSLNTKQIENMKTTHDVDSNWMLKDCIQWTESVKAINNTEISKAPNVNQLENSVRPKQTFATVMQGNNSNAGPGVLNAQRDVSAGPRVSDTAQPNQRKVGAQWQAPQQGGPHAMGTVSQPKTHEQQAKERETEQRKLNIIIEGVNESVYGKEGDEAAVCEILTFIECKHRIKHINYIERIGRNTFNRGKPRLIKVEFKVIAAAYETVFKSHNLYYSHKFGAVYFRKDLSREEREKEWNQRRRNTSGESTITAAPTMGAASNGAATTEIVAPAPNEFGTPALANPVLGDSTQRPEGNNTVLTQVEEGAQAVDNNRVPPIDRRAEDESTTGSSNRDQETAASGNEQQEGQGEVD